MTTLQIPAELVETYTAPVVHASDDPQYGLTPESERAIRAWLQANVMGTTLTDPRGYEFHVDKITFSGVSRFHSATVYVSGRVIREYNSPGAGWTTYGAYASVRMYEAKPLTARSADCVAALARDAVGRERYITDGKVLRVSFPAETKLSAHLDGSAKPDGYLVLDLESGTEHAITLDGVLLVNEDPDVAAAYCNGLRKGRAPGRPGVEAARGIVQREVAPGVWEVRTDRYRLETFPVCRLVSLVTDADGIAEGDPVEIV